MAQSVTATVSGASVGTSNGTFVVTDQVALFERGGLGRPARALSFLPVSPTNPIGSNPFSIPGLFALARFDTGMSFVSPGNGNDLTLASLQDVMFTFARPTSNSQLTNSADRQFDARNIVTTAIDLDAPDVAPVPLPAALPLMLVGLGGFAALRRRRAASAA